LTRQICSISFEIKRQIALLLTRKGEVTHVLVGDTRSIWIPDLSRFRGGVGRLKGIRCVHTHLRGEGLSREDISDLVLLGLDLMVCVQVDANGIPGPLHYAHVVPDDKGGKGWIDNRVADIGRLDVNFIETIQSLEEELARKTKSRLLDSREKALLVGVSAGARWQEDESLDELEALTLSDDVEVVGREIQRINKMDPRFLIRRGKLSELVLRCLQTGAGLMIFNNELTPAQVKSLTDFTEMKIIDRSQLILDIFARRAVTREGKIQVELAQLKYLLPRLATKNTAMSRLTGGIGGRGPGETKLEINRRRVRDRIGSLNKELKHIKTQRRGRRRLREAKGIPVISIVGYTNAGKSTLLNALTHSRVGVGNRLFETLDPSSRRLRFPHEREAIITDTVGFIRNLPRDLMDAFAATLEELQDADVLLHVIDISSPRFEEQIKTVDGVLVNLRLKEIPLILVLNKADLMGSNEVRSVEKKLGGVAISAIHPPSLLELTKRIEEIIWSGSSNYSTRMI
jgi:GTP-binding protein HflX